MLKRLITASIMILLSTSVFADVSLVCPRSSAITITKSTRYAGSYCWSVVNTQTGNGSISTYSVCSSSQPTSVLGEAVSAKTAKDYNWDTNKWDSAIITCYYKGGQPHDGLGKVKLSFYGSCHQTGTVSFSCHAN